MTATVTEACDPDLSGSARSLHEEVLGHLRKFVIEGDLPEGERIPERQLCDQLGISRTPLREALKVLAAEGLVDLLPNRGARIKVLTEADIRELFEVMGGLEALSGRLACASITDAEIAAVEDAHYRMYQGYIARNLSESSRYNRQIHAMILAAAGNATLTAIYRNFDARIQRVRFQANMDPSRDRWSEAMREHEMILDALRRRDGPALSDLLFTHLQGKCRSALEHLRARRGGEG